MEGFEHHHERGPYAATLQEQIDCLPLEVCWRVYQDLCRQQEAVISGNDDENAFRYGPRRLPALKRVTITPAAHKYLLHSNLEIAKFEALRPLNLDFFSLPIVV